LAELRLAGREIGVDIGQSQKTDGGYPFLTGQVVSWQSCHWLNGKEVSIPAKPAQH
jgi:hypothetical protein